MTLQTCLKVSTAVSVALWLSAAEAQVTVIKAGELVDPETGTTQTGQTLVIQDGNILAVGENPRIPEGAVELDLSTLTVLPGLIDAHTHMATSYKFPTSNLKQYNVDVPTAERAIQGLLNAQSMLETGFTTIRDLGNAGNFADAALLRFLSVPPIANMGQVAEFAIARPGQIGKVLGPTTFISGKIISVYGGQFRLNPEHTDVGLTDYFYADTHEELKKAIRENIHHGASWIKIVMDDFRYIYSVEDVQFIVEEARRAGLKVAAHAVTRTGAIHAIEGGVASIEHGYEMDDETLELAKERGVVLVGCELADTTAQAFRGGIYEVALDRLKRAHRIGVEMAYGSDILMERPGVTRGELSIASLDTWAKSGMPAEDILRAMTVNGAKLLGIADQRGGIRPGMAADLIGTPENPLEDILTLKRVSFVMKDGVVVRRD